MNSTVKQVETFLEPSLTVRISQASQTLSREAQWRLFTLGLILNDILLTGCAFYLAYEIRFGSSLPVFQLDVTPIFPFYRKLSITLLLLWLAIFGATGLYKRRNLLGGTQEYALVFRATSIGLLLVIVVGFLEPDFILARGWLLLGWFFAFLMVSSGRFLMRRLVYHLRRQGYFLSSALIVGANREGCSLAEQLIGWQTSGLHILGFVDDQVAPATPVHRHLQVLGTTDRLDTFIRNFDVEELILATSALSRDEMLAIFQRYGMVKGLNLRLSSGLFEVITTGLEVKEMAYVPLVRINKVRLTGIDRTLKLILDYSLAIPALTLLLPVLLLIAIAIKLDSPGPIIYRRRVMGLNGQQFDAYKFRTMYMNGNRILDARPELKSELERNHKLKNDPRVTRVGQILRQLSLDELPQLFNVLRGQMSLVGPRMISPAEMSMYAEWGMNLLTVPPGITGLWQVSGRSDISYEERVHLDMHYIRNWTIWSDLQLLIQTIPAVLKGRGAY